MIESEGVNKALTIMVNEGIHMCGDGRADWKKEHWEKHRSTGRKFAIFGKDYIRMSNFLKGQFLPISSSQLIKWFTNPSPTVHLFSHTSLRSKSDFDIIFKMRRILHIGILLSLSCLSYSYITKEERKLVKKLKSMTIESLNTHDIAKLELNGYIENYVNKTSDLMFLNFVKHSDKELKKAMQMLLTNLEWRKLNDIDNVEEWDPPEGMIQDFPYQITGYTRKENPVLYIAGGRWDFQKWVSMGHGNDVIKYFIQMIERAQMATRGKFDPDTGDEPSQYITIVNMEGFSIRQVTSIRVLRMLGSFFGIYDANYPLATEDLVILKAPQIFAVFFDFVKNFLKISGQERYIGFVRLIGNDENIWKPIIFNAIPTEAIPKSLGGKFDIPF